MKMFNDKMLPSEFLYTWLSNDLLPLKEKTVFKNYYRSYLRQFPQYMRNNYDHRLEPAVNIARKQGKNIRLLEIGSGCGTEALYFSLIGCEIVAVELKKKMYEVAERRKNILEDKIGRTLNCEFKNISILDFDSENKFDLIWLEETFHHLEPRNLVIKKISSLLKPGGHLVISETNALNILIQVWLFRVRGFKRISARTDENGTNYIGGVERVLRAKKLARLFSKENVRMNNIDYYRLLPNIFPDSKFFEIIDIFFNHYIPTPIRKFLSVHYNYVGRFA